ncbi:hypothetical protein D3C81_1880310 [compost metagenome]
MVDDRRDPVVGGDLEEIRFELLTLADVHRNDPVGQAGFFEHQGDFVSIGRGPVMQVDHGVGSCEGAVVVLRHRLGNRSSIETVQLTPATTATPSQALR